MKIGQRIYDCKRKYVQGWFAGWTPRYFAICRTDSGKRYLIDKRHVRQGVPHTLSNLKYMTKGV